MKKCISLLAITVLLLFSLIACSGTADTEVTDDLTPTMEPESTPMPPEEVPDSTQDNQNLLYSRLHEGEMPEFIPSDDYGLLLFYAGIVTQSTGRNQTTDIVKYGLVTVDGVIVTDLIYDEIERASIPSSIVISPPAYMLSVRPPDGPNGERYALKNAAVALDGSWITPFDYGRITFSEDVIMCMNNQVSTDIDVYDYEGNLLYNMSDCDWIDEIQWNRSINEITYTISEGWGWVRVESPHGIMACVDIFTGKATYLNYNEIERFYNGMAAVKVIHYDYDSDPDYTQLWGFINKELELVIDVKYKEKSWNYSNDTVAVKAEDNNWYIIDKQGEILFSFDKGKRAGARYPRPGYFSYDSNNKVTYYTEDFNIVSYPERVYEAMNENPDVSVYGLEGGWLKFYDQPHGVYLFSYDEEYFFSDVNDISFTDGEYVFCHYTRETGAKLIGVFAIDGREIIPMQEKISITRIYGDFRIELFMLNSGEHSQYQKNYRVVPDLSTIVSKTEFHRLININGDEVISGPGRLMYDDTIKLFYVATPEYFNWLDSDGNVFISIPFEN